MRGWMIALAWLWLAAAPCAAQEFMKKSKKNEPKIAAPQTRLVQKQPAKPSRRVHEPVPERDTTESKPVELLQAMELLGKTLKGMKAKVLTGSDSMRVVFEHAGSTLFCNEAIQYTDSNYVEAYGNVRIEQGDSITITGDSLFYFGDTKMAIMRGNVVMRDSSRTLITQYMQYDIRRNTASYHGGGKVVDDSMRLTSKSGYYNTRTEMMSFQGDVVYDSPQDGKHLESDSLVHDMISRKLYFTSKTLITTEDGDLVANSGSYDLRTGEADFGERASAETEDFVITGDQLRQSADRANASGNVSLYRKQDSVTIYGDQARFDKTKGTTWVTGRALMVRPMGNRDTLFLAADTLFALNDTVSGRQEIQAWRNVKIFSRQMEGLADSLSYVVADSVLSFFHDPILWNAESQMSADTIRIKLRDNSVDTLFLLKKAFMLTQNLKRQTNQIKGRDMTAKFRNNNVNRVDVNGNGQCIYFVLDSLKFIGMNKVECSNMVLLFADSNELKTISFLRKPVARFVPPHEIQEPDTRLPGFAWRADERPGRGFVDSILIRQGVRPPGKRLMDSPFELYLYQDSLILYRDPCSPQMLDYDFLLTFQAARGLQLVTESQLPDDPPPVSFLISRSELQGTMLLKTIPLPDASLAAFTIGQINEAYQPEYEPDYQWLKRIELNRPSRKPTAEGLKMIPSKRKKEKGKK